VEHELIVPIKEVEKKRSIWVSGDVSALITGRKNPAAGFPSVKYDADLGRYCKGFIVSATRRLNGKSDFKWLTGHDEVWVLSFRQPPPGWRVFGRFAKPNVFVGLCYYDREELGDLVAYNAAAKALVKKWDLAFPGVEPFRGQSFGDYLGEMHRDDDAD
jgi:hypothetical protein